MEYRIRHNNNLKIILTTLIIIFISMFFCTNVKSASKYEFNYTGDYQVFEVPRSGVYKLETWGAQGGYRSNAENGKGGYSKGLVYLNRGDVLYIYVGGSGKTHKGYNGGGEQPTLKIYGGGATDIRFKGGNWNNADGLNSRLIVAGGGGSDGSPNHPGGVGGTTGGSTGGCGAGGVGATLSGAGSLRAGFGYGGSGKSGQGGHAGAGGGGWYGGGGSDPDYSSDDDRGGGGGSSFTWNSNTKKNVPKSYSVSEKYYMTEVSYTSGTRKGDGFARITPISVSGITNVEINRGKVAIDFKYNVYNYNLVVDNDVENIRFNISVENGYTLTQTAQSTNMTDKNTVTNVLTLTDSESGIVQVYSIKINKQNGHLENRSTVSYGYSYTGDYQLFYVPATGIYTLETWGAQGGHRGNNNGGKGGYSSAEMTLSKGEILYVYVGGSGQEHKGYNGGGHTTGYYSEGGVWHETTNTYGGGASDIRYGGTSLYHRVLVAGGGGSVGSTSNAGGPAGISANSGCGTGGMAGTISAPGDFRAKFGYGGDGAIGNNGYGGAGGGGWYGGGGTNPDGSADDDRGGGGGSGFAYTAANASNVPSGYLVDDKSYLTNARILAGNASMPNPNGGNETGHAGDGYVRITPKLINGVNDVIVNNGDIQVDFDYTKYLYHISILDSVDSLDINFILNEGYSKVESYTGIKDITNLKQYTYVVDVTNDITGLKVTYTFVFHKQSDYLMENTGSGLSSYGYSYKGYQERFIAPATGIYTLETWGAQGGGRGTNKGGKGGYAKGQIFLNKGQVLYVNVGGSGDRNGYNGGGRMGSTSTYGGGASDIRYRGTTLNDRLIVAGGGGSVGSTNLAGGYGGGLVGGNGSSEGCGTQSFGGTQTSGGANRGTFGRGGSGIVANGGYGGAGGGGWYGGGGSNPDGSADDDKSGAGGSGFVWTEETSKNVPFEYSLTENDYLLEAVNKGGNTSFPAPKGGNETGHSGDGFVKISFSLAFDYEIKVDDYITLDNEFDFDLKEYTGTLDTYDHSLVTFEVTNSKSISKIIGDGTHEIHVGDNTFSVSITYINGIVDVYNYHIYREANNIDYLNDIYFDGHSISEFSDVTFDKDTFSYNVTLPYYMDEYDLTVNKGSSDQVITNIGHTLNKNHNYQIPISVTNETGTSTKTYTLNITYPHSSKIKNLIFNSSGGSVLEFPLEKDKTEYEINIESHIAAVTAVVDLYDAEASATVTGDGYITDERFDITIVVDEPNVDSTTYVIHANRITVSGYEKAMGYNGNVQTIVIPYDHEYFLQVWGAQGGAGGGRGGYSSGKIYLEKGTILYVYAGGSGDSGGFNGGGSSLAGKGGGASDIRIGTDSLYSRVIVAGGGGGHGRDGCAAGAPGGGLNGSGGAQQGSCGIQATGGTSTSAGTPGKYNGVLGFSGKFGIGANSSNSGGSWYGGAGGGGWYGGGSGTTSGWSNGGGGGSGFIYTAETASLIENNKNWLLDSKYYLTEATTLSGTNTFEAPKGGNETGHLGNGYAKITIPYQESENNYLDGIISNRGVMTPDWDYNTDTYYLNLASDEVEINLEGVPADGKASVVGNGDYIIEAGTTRIPIVVTAENGYTKTYTVVVTREADKNSLPKNILINGLIKDYCESLDGACVYHFNPETKTYNVTVPYSIREIVMVVDKAHYFQTVNGDGLYELKGNDNEFQIDVTSEDKSSTSSYVYNIYRDMTGNADLKTLKLISPESDINYSYNVTDYYVSVPKETETIEIEAIADDEFASVKIDKPETLEYGENTITITVTAANGKTKQYYVYVNRLKSNNAYLNELTITNITDSKNEEITLNPEFNKMNLRYELTVENDISKILLDGVLEDSEFATATGLGEYNLNVGANTINVVVNAQDNSSLTYTFVINRKANSNTLLADLSVLEGTLTQSFSPTTFVYYMYVTGDVESLNINALPQVDTSNYQIIGNSNYLVAGKNEIIIRVTAQDNSTCDYKIIVNRAGYTDNYLQSLTVSYGNEIYPLTPNFDPLYDKYTLNLPNDIDNVIITATADNTKRTKIGSSSIYVKNVNLLTENPSNNSIVVTAEDGTTRLYTLNITRELSDDSSLRSIEVNNNTYEPVFASNILEYSFTTNDRSLNITAIPTNRFAKVKISDNAKSLAAGENQVTIDVTSEMGSTTTYVLNVTRIPSSDDSLKSLTLSGIEFNSFDPETLEYNFDTHNSTTSINALANNQYASVEIKGNTNLAEGNNRFEIVVTSEAGTKRTYIVNINRILDDNSYLSNLTTSLGLNKAFNKEDLEYSITTEQTKITINATVESNYATYNITDSSGNIISTFPTNLSLGQNIFFVNVTAQNGNVRNYKITVTRNLSSDNKLSNLTTSAGLNETFNPDKNQYTVNTTEHEITITPTPRHENATFVIYDANGDVVDKKASLETGQNMFMIIVTAEDGTTGLYNLVVNRNRKNIATIEKLGFEVNPTFNKNTFDYSITIDDTSLNLDNLELTDPYSTYVVEGNSNFTFDGPNTVRIIVTSEDESKTNTYTINATRVVSSDARLKTFKLNEYEFIPKFDKDTYSYEVYVPSTLTNPTLELNTLKEVANITNIAINDVNISLQSNTYNNTINIPSVSTEPTITITVTAENGETKDYSLIVSNEDLINNYLSTLNVSCGNLTPVFDKETSSYVVYTGFDTTSCNVLATPEVTTSTVTGVGDYEFPTTDKYLSVPITVTPKRKDSRVYTITIRRPASSESRIETLNINGGTINPIFDKDREEYAVDVPNSIDILNKDSFTYTTVDPDATVDFKEVRLPSGQVTRYIITSTAEDKTNTSTYILNVTRAKSSDTTITSVTASVSGSTFTCQMNPETKSCDLELPSTTEKFSLTADLPYGASVVPANPSPQVFESNLQNKDIRLDVTAEDGTTDQYTVHLIRALSNNNDLLDIKVNAVSLPNFSSSKLSYDKTVLGTMSQVLLSARVADNKATILTDLSNPFNLNYGVNSIDIVVRAEDGTEKTYTININRSNSEDANLSSLQVKNYPFVENFDPEETEYTIRVPRTKQTLNKNEILYTLSDPDSVISMDNKIDIDFSRPNNIYSITVTAGDGVHQKTYHISVLPVLSTNNNVTSIVVDGQTLTHENNIFNYSIFLDESTATLNRITLSDEFATYSVMLPVTLNFGTPFTFAVTAEDGSVATYTVNLVRNKTKELKLANIEANFKQSDDCDGICTFDKTFAEDTTEYEIYIPNELTRLEFLNITTKDEYQTYEVIGNTDFSIGENIVIIRVKNSLNETFDYTLKVYREANSDPNLAGIKFTIPELVIEDFDESVYEYNVEFNGIASGKYTIEADKKNENQTVSIGGSKVLYFGRNDIIVHSKSESCNTDVKTRAGCNERDYIIHSYRNEYYSNLLESLTVASGDIGDLLQVFNKYKMEYVFEVDSEVSEIKIEGTQVDTEHTTVTGNGEYNLKQGLNTFTITVTPEIGDPATYTLNIIRKQDGNVNLEDLKVKNFELSPEFSKNVVDYYIDVPSTTNSLDITYIKEVENQTVYISGNSNFVTGENIVNVIVLSADKTRGKTYRIHANRLPSDNNLLNKLEVSNVLDNNIIYPLTPAFNSNENNYIVNVDKNINQVHIDTTKGQIMQRVVGAGDYAIDYGENIINVVVTSESGLVNTYQVKVIRAFDFALDSLTVSNDKTIYDLNPSLTNGVFEYTVDVPYEVDNVDINAVLHEQLNTIDGLGNYPLETGENTITFTVSYLDKADVDYIIHVNRAKCGDNNLSSLQVAEGVIEPIFDPSVLEYSVNIPYEFDSATVLYETNSDSATVNVTNNTDLEIGITKDIQVVVTAENGDTKTYIIHATKLPKPTASNRLIDMYIDESPLDPVFEIGTMNYSADVDKDVKRINLHIRAEEPNYSTVEVYKLGTADISSIDMTSSDPRIMLSVETGKNSFIIRVTNYEGSIRNYQLDVYRMGPNEARIKSLEFDYGTFTPRFDKNKLVYRMEVENNINQVIEDITMMDLNATYTITGNKNLKVGENIITITTLAQDRVTSWQYTVIVTKKASSNAYLSDIVTFPEKNFEFNKEKYNYVYHVDNNVNTVQIIGVREDTRAKITGNGIYTLNSEEKRIDLTVTAEDGTTKVYSVLVTKKKDNNANLETLTINNGDLKPDFDPSTTNYTVDVENYVESITLNGLPESSKATVSGNQSYDLAVGENKLSLVVTAEDGTLKTYFVTVNRKENVLAKTLLDDLTVEEGELQPNFNPNVFNYVVNIPYEYESITVNYVKHHEDAIVQIFDNEKLQVGSNTVIVKVSYNEEGTTYTLEVVRQEASNTYLSDLVVLNHTITPEFDKNNQNYTLNLPNGTNTLSIKAVPELSSSKVYIKTDNDYTQVFTNADLNITDKTNTIYIKVVSSKMTERVYKINLNKAISDENKLLTLTSSTGELTPEFNPDTNSYTLNVPVGTTEVTLSGTVSDNASVTGLDTYPVVVGSKTEFITVTSQSGIVNTYSITIVREASNDASITNIIPSTGPLFPLFTPGIAEYRLEVEGDVLDISFDVTTTSPLATVTGNKNIPLFSGNNIITITSTAEDGITTESVNITVYKKTDITSFETQEEIDVIIGTTHQLEIKYNPENTDYKSMNYSVSNSSILTIDENGLITPHQLGDTTITVTSTRNPSLTKQVLVHVINPMLETDTYIINREIGYVTGMEPYTTVEDFLANFKNDKETLQVYDATDTNLISDETEIKSYYIIKLVINNTVYDELKLIILGDADGDGYITVSDANIIRNYIAGRIRFNVFEAVSTDIDLDTYSTVTDVNKVLNYIAGRTKSLNTDLYEKVSTE